MPDGFFKCLSEEEQDEYRMWAINNYKPGSPISGVWHPVVRKECERINAERNQRTSNSKNS